MPRKKKVEEEKLFPDEEGEPGALKGDGDIESPEGSEPVDGPKTPKGDKEGNKRPFDREDPVARGIALGTMLLGAYVLNEMLSDKTARRDQNGNWIIEKKGPLSDLLD